MQEKDTTERYNLKVQEQHERQGWKRNDKEMEQEDMLCGDIWFKDGRRQRCDSQFVVELGRTVQDLQSQYARQKSRQMCDKYK